jgi:hypothetical protein
MIERALPLTQKPDRTIWSFANVSQTLGLGGLQALHLAQRIAV